MNTFFAEPNAVGGSLGLSALVATIPLLTFFIMLLVVKARAHWSALVALAASILVASLGFTMPFDLAGLSAVRGAIYGLVICWVILGAIWFYQVTVLAGRFEAPYLRPSGRRRFAHPGDSDCLLLRWSA